MSEPKKKKIYFEVIRIFAIFMVVFQHTNLRGQMAYFDATSTAEYLISLMLSLFCKIAVPLFFMISGALLLGREESLKTLYTKRVWRMAVVLGAFSVLVYLAKVYLGEFKFGIGDFVRKFYTCNITTTYWYLYAYIAVLILLPLLRKMVALMELKDYVYLLAINLVFVTILPTFENMGLNADLTNHFAIGLVTSRNTFFFIMGYGMDKLIKEEWYTKKNVMYAAVVGLLFVTICAVFTHIIAKRDGYTKSDAMVLYNNYVSLTSLSTFFVIKFMDMKIKLPAKAEKVITFLGANVFGVYLFECLFRRALMPVYDGLLPYIGRLPACFVYVFVVVAAGIGLTALLRLIPPVKKYI